MSDGRTGHAATAPARDKGHSCLRSPGAERGDVVRVGWERDGGGDQAGDAGAFAVDGARVIVDPEGTAERGGSGLAHGGVKQELNANAETVSCHR